MFLNQYCKTVISRIGFAYAQLLNKKKYYAQTFDGINERPVEYSFLFRQLIKAAPKKVLDVGTGLTSLPHLMRGCGFVVTAIDNIKDYWSSGMVNHHYYIINDDITCTRLRNTFDFITCVSTLEHIKDHDSAVKSMFYLLNTNGYLVLTFPYNENKYVDDVYTLPGSSVKETFSFTTQAFSRNELDSWLTQNRGILVEQEYWQFYTGNYWTEGELLNIPIQVSKDEPHQVSCILIRKSD